MCAAAISLARFAGLRFAAEDPKGGAVVHGPRLFGQPTCHHRPDVLGGIGEAEAGELLRNFFAERRLSG
jgi:tRNA(Arg) A34 adenosine deaminase TadA